MLLDLLGKLVLKVPQVLTATTALLESQARVGQTAGQVTAALWVSPAPRAHRDPLEPLERGAVPVQRVSQDLPAPEVLPVI